MGSPARSSDCADNYSTSLPRRFSILLAKARPDLPFQSERFNYQHLPPRSCQKALELIAGQSLSTGKGTTPDCGISAFSRGALKARVPRARECLGPCDTGTLVSPGGPRGPRRPCTTGVCSRIWEQTLNTAKTPLASIFPAISPATGLSE